MGRHTTALAGAATALVLLATGWLPGTASASSGTAISAPRHGYILYWDQNEEVDYYASAANTEGQLLRPWDLNGQVCLLGDGTGRWVGGYDPTLPSQHNPGGPPHHPYKQPPIGEELVNRHGGWTGQNLYVPGPYRMKAGDPGEDSPAVDGVYNGQSTYTGCAVDSHHNVFADDLGTAQGAFPIPTDGRLVEWFAPSYKTYCIVYGPTAGGVDGAHHVDGSGGLAQPGMMTTLPNGNLLLPQGGSSTGDIGGNVLEFDHASLPSSAAACPDGVYPRSKVHASVFVQGTSSLLPIPMAVAHDPACNCYAVDSIFGSPAIAWFDAKGNPVAGHAVVNGETLTQFGHDDGGYNPFGMAFAPDGTLYLVDIHITCRTAGFGNCGPQGGQGRVMRIPFGPGGQPGNPQVVATGFSFPTSVTLCVPRQHWICPFPAGSTPPPNAAPRTGRSAA